MGGDEGGRPLEPLAYQQSLVAHLKREEPHAWEWSSSGALTQEADEIRDAMLHQIVRWQVPPFPEHRAQTARRRCARPFGVIEGVRAHTAFAAWAPACRPRAWL
jgi:hypothetical protein